MDGRGRRMDGWEGNEGRKEKGWMEGDEGWMDGKEMKEGRR